MAFVAERRAEDHRYLDAMFAEILQSPGSFALLEMWSVQKLAGDPFVLSGLLTATDGDADSLNDFSGTGLFAVTADQVDTSGHPAARVVTSTAKRGAYAIDFTGQTVNLPGFALPAGSKILVEGTATAASNTGTIGVRRSVSDSAGRRKAWPIPRSGFGMSIENAGSKPRRRSPLTRATANSGWPGTRARAPEASAPSNASPT